MKKSFSLLLSLFVLSVTAFGQLKIMPESAKPGDKIKLKYLTENSPVKDFDDIKLVAFANTKEAPEAFDIKTESGEGYLKGYFQIPEDACSVLIAVKANDGNEVDNNNGDGYYILLSDEKGNPVPHAHSSAAMIFGRYYRFAGLEKNYEKAIKLMDKEFKLYPENKSEHLSYYAFLQSRVDKEGAKEVLAPELAKLLTKRKKKEQDYSLMQALYNYTGNSEKVTELESKILKKFPKGDLAFSKKVRAFYNAKTAADKAPIMEEMATKFSKEPKDLEYYHSNIATVYAKEQNWDKFNEHLNKITNKSTIARTLNSAAWDLSGADLEKEAIDAKMAEKYAAKAIKLTKEGINTPDSESKPPYYTASEWEKSMKRTFGMYADTYALALYKNGNAEKALKYQKKSCAEGEWKDPKGNERYCVYHCEVVGGSESEKMLEKMIRSGKGSSKINELYKTTFLENHTLESAFEKYFAIVEKDAKKHMFEELKKDMIDLDAPSFVLRNLSGEEVSLNSLKGKIIILDFWATWCGPCKASFPGMQKAVDKFANDDQVEFLFIDSWERGEEKEKNASEFINKHSYTFNVLMDNDDKVIGSYKVEGIPTKFVLGMDGRIKFKSIGFDGNDDKLVDELTMMIELLKKDQADKEIKISMSGK